MNTHRRGFSLVEMLVSLTITATLLTAALTALDAGFKGYKFTTSGFSPSALAVNRSLCLRFLLFRISVSAAPMMCLVERKFSPSAIVVVLGNCFSNCRMFEMSAPRHP